MFCLFLVYFDMLIYWYWYINILIYWYNWYIDILIYLYIDFDILWKWASGHISIYANISFWTWDCQSQRPDIRSHKSIRNKRNQWQIMKHVLCICTCFYFFYMLSNTFYNCFIVFSNLLNVFYCLFYFAFCNVFVMFLLLIVYCCFLLCCV